MKKLLSLCSVRMKGINAPTRSSIAFTASGIISKAAALLLTPIFTRLFSSSEYGEYSLFNSYLSIAVVLGTLELGGSVSLRAFQRFRGKEYTVILTAIGIILPTTLAVTSGFAITRRLLDSRPLFTGAYPMLAISVISAGVINLFTSRAKFLYKPRLAIILSFLQGIAAPVLAIIFIYFGAFGGASPVAIKVGAASAVSGLCAVLLCTVAVIKAKKELVELPRREASRLSKKCAALLLRLSLPLIPYYFSVMAIAQADKITISETLGRSTLGAYSVAYSAGLAPLSLSQGLICALTPWVMRRARCEEYRRISKTVTASFTMLCSAIAVFLSCAPEIFSFLAPREYLPALPITFIMALAPLPLLLMNLESSILCAHEKSIFTAATGICVSALSVIATVFLTPRFGIAAAAACIVVAYCAIATVQGVNIYRISHQPILDSVNCVRGFLLCSILSGGYYALSDALGARLLLSLIPLASLIYMLKRDIRLLKDK